MADLVEVVDTTRYLCWIKARPGETVNLQVSYTALDAKHELERTGRGETVQRIVQGVVEPRYDRRKVWAEWYRQLGIYPLNYEFSVPSQSHASSYYFSIEAPVGSYVTYLDWETSNSLNDKELDCAFPSAHVHNEEGSITPSTRGGTIRAYVRSASHHHKQILGITLLNGLLVFLLTVDRLPAKLGSAQSLLLAVPSGLIAYLVQQQKHYHAHATRKQRAILWGYLAINVTFLLTIAFNHHEGTIGSRGLGPFATVVTWILGAASAGVFVWYLPQGHGFGRGTEWLVRRRKRRVLARLSRAQAALKAAEETYPQASLEQRDWYKQAKKSLTQTEESTQPWRCYERGVHQYCSATLRAAIVASMIVLGAVILGWRFPRHVPHGHRHKATHQQVLGLSAVASSAAKLTSVRGGK